MGGWEACCVNRRHGTNISNIKISTHLLECFGKIWRRSVQSTYLINSLKVAVFLPKSYARFYLIKICKQLTPGDYLASWNLKTIGQRDFLTSVTIDQDFQGKVTHSRHVFYFFLSRSLSGASRRRQNNEQSCQRLNKNPIRGDCSCFCIKAGTCIKKRKPRFLTFCMAILVWRRFLSASTSHFHKEIYLFSWKNGTLSFFPGPVFFFFCSFFFFYQGLSSAFNFSTNKELPRANFVKYAANKIWKEHENEPQHERLPRKFPQGIRSGPRLWHLSDFMIKLLIEKRGKFLKKLRCCVGGIV